MPSVSETASLEELAAQYHEASENEAIARWALIEAIREEHHGDNHADVMGRTGMTSPAIVSALTCQGTRPQLLGHVPEFR